MDCTKRIMLSNIVQIFDLLDLLASIIVTAKILMQQLWRLQIDWDESPSDIFASLTMLHAAAKRFLRMIQRQVGDTLESEIQLHGFCDVSE